MGQTSGDGSLMPKIARKANNLQARIRSCQTLTDLQGPIAAAVVNDDELERIVPVRRGFRDTAMQLINASLFVVGGDDESKS